MGASKSVRALLTTIKILLSLTAFFVSGYFLYYFEYFSEFGQIDNLIGILPVTLAVVFTGSITALLWIKHNRRLAAVSVVLAMFAALSAGLFPTALRGNWWLHTNMSAEGSDPDISVYAPFTGEQTARLEEPASLTLEGDLPVLDGALALYPVYAAVAEATYSEAAYGSGESVVFTDTVQAFRSLIAGERDIIFTARASAGQLEMAKEAGVELCMTPIGKEAFVFLAGAENPIESLTLQQIRNVYSGKTANWATLGWKEGGQIIAYQRPEGSGSQTGIQSIMGKLPLIAPQPLPDKSLVGSNSLMQQISVRWKGVQPALGYSYRYFATAMNPNEGAKMLDINGIAPTAENIASGAYPFSVQFYAITRGEPKGNAKLLIDWLLTPQGQTLIEKTGYVPL